MDSICDRDTCNAYLIYPCILQIQILQYNVVNFNLKNTVLQITSIGSPVLSGTFHFYKKKLYNTSCRFYLHKYVRKDTCKIGFGNSQCLYAMVLYVSFYSKVEKQRYLYFWDENTTFLNFSLSLSYLLEVSLFQ